MDWILRVSDRRKRISALVIIFVSRMELITELNTSSGDQFARAQTFKEEKELTLKGKMNEYGIKSGQKLQGYDLFVLRGKNAVGDFDLEYLANEECADASEFPFYSSWSCRLAHNPNEAVRPTSCFPRLICIAAPLPTKEFTGKWKNKPWWEVPSVQLANYALFNKVYPIVYPEGNFSCFTYPDEKEYYPVLSVKGDLWAYCADPFDPKTPLPKGFYFLQETNDC